MYFIDHINRKIHNKRNAGDACGFTETPPEDREFTNCADTIARLEDEESYKKCPSCHTRILLTFPYSERR